MPETVVHFQIRMPPVMHERMASRAVIEKRSLNALIVAILTHAAAGRQAEADQTAQQPSSEGSVLK